MKKQIDKTKENRLQQTDHPLDFIHEQGEAEIASRKKNDEEIKPRVQREQDVQHYWFRCFFIMFILFVFGSCFIWKTINVKNPDFKNFQCLNPEYVFPPVTENMQFCKSTIKTSLTSIYLHGEFETEFPNNEKLLEFKELLIKYLETISYDFNLVAILPGSIKILLEGDVSAIESAIVILKEEKLIQENVENKMHEKKSIVEIVKYLDTYDEGSTTNDEPNLKEVIEGYFIDDNDTKNGDELRNTAKVIPNNSIVQLMGLVEQNENFNGLFGIVNKNVSDKNPPCYSVHVTKMEQYVCLHSKNLLLVNTNEWEWKITHGYKCVFDENINIVDRETTEKVTTWKLTEECKSVCDANPECGGFTRRVIDKTCEFGHTTLATEKQGGYSCYEKTTTNDAPELFSFRKHILKQDTPMELLIHSAEIAAKMRKMIENSDKDFKMSHWRLAAEEKNYCQESEVDGQADCKSLFDILFENKRTSAYIYLYHNAELYQPELTVKKQEDNTARKEKVFLLKNIKKQIQQKNHMVHFVDWVQFSNKFIFQTNHQKFALCGDEIILGGLDLIPITSGENIFKQPIDCSRKTCGWNDIDIQIQHEGLAKELNAWINYLMFDTAMPIDDEIHDDSEGGDWARFVVSKPQRIGGLTGGNPGSTCYKETPEITRDCNFLYNNSCSCYNKRLVVNECQVGWNAVPCHPEKLSLADMPTKTNEGEFGANEAIGDFINKCDHHSELDRSSPAFWAINFRKEKIITSVKLYNCCPEELQNVLIRVGDDWDNMNDNPIVLQNINVPKNGQLEVIINNAIGQYLWITKTEDSAKLAICKIEIFESNHYNSDYICNESKCTPVDTQPLSPTMCSMQLEWIETIKNIKEGGVLYIEQQYIVSANSNRPSVTNRIVKTILEQFQEKKFKIIIVMGGRPSPKWTILLEYILDTLIWANDSLYKKMQNILGDEDIKGYLSIVMPYTASYVGNKIIAGTYFVHSKVVLASTMGVVGSGNVNDRSMDCTEGDFEIGLQIYHESKVQEFKLKAIANFGFCRCVDYKDKAGEGDAECAENWCYVPVGTCDDGERSTKIPIYDKSKMACESKIKYENDDIIFKTWIEKAKKDTDNFQTHTQWKCLGKNIEFEGGEGNQYVDKKILIDVVLLMETNHGGIQNKKTYVKKCISYTKKDTLSNFFFTDAYN